MPISAKSARISGALLIAIVLVAAGYALPGFSAYKTKPVNAELTDELLAAYVSKDTDADGLPDWQESLYGTSVSNPDSDNDGISDGEAVRRGLLTPSALSSQIPQDPIGEEDFPGNPPAEGSLTEQFSRSFLEAYLEASGGQPMSAEAQQALVQRLLADFATRASRSFESSYSLVSIRTDASVSVAAYSSAVETILRANDLGGNDADALAFMQQLIVNEDKSAVTKLNRISSAHRAMTNELAAVRVPPHLADEHLSLLLSFDSLAKSTGAVARYDSDPLGVLGALTAYQPAAASLASAMEAIALEVLKNGEPGPGQPGSLIVFIARYTPDL